MSLRRSIVILHDALATLLALFAAFLLRWGLDAFTARIDTIAPVCFATLPVALAAYWLLRLPHAPWRFVSVGDLSRLAVAAAVPAGALVLVGFLARGEVVVPRTVPVIYWLVQVALLAGPRLLYRVYRSGRRNRRAFRGLHRVPVLIAGTDDEADALIRRLRRDAVSSLEPVGLLTTKPRHLGERIQGVSILGPIDALEAVARALEARGTKARRLVVTAEVLRHPGVDDLLGAARRLGIAAVRAPPSLTELGERDGALKLAPVSIDDLLGRSARELDLAPVRALVGGACVLVTGAGGSIGAELCRQVAAMAPARLVLLDQSELALWSVSQELATLHPDVTLVRHLGTVVDRADLDRVFGRHAPDLVFHAAALKHVDIVEAHPIAAAATNTLGTRAVAEAAEAAGVRCAVFISTDKAVDPVSVLGATKRAGELVFAAADRRSRIHGKRFLTVRFGNVLGSSGSVIPLFTEQLRHGGPVTVTHPDVERYFMTIPEAVRLVLMASAAGLAASDLSPTFVLDMGRPVRIVDLARRMIRLAGLEPDVDVAITFTGLRPGERLTELLEGTAEQLRPTAVPGVSATSAPAAEAAGQDALLDRLAAAVARHDEPAVLALLGALVAGYGSRPAPALPDQAAE